MTEQIARPPAPKWAKWRLMPKVRIWQAAALSLNICPDWLWSLQEIDASELLRDRWMGVLREWKDRCDIVSANSDEMEAQQNDEYPGHATISLQLFLVWAMRVGLEIPEELKAISSVAPSAAVAQDEAQHGRRAATSRDDKEFREWALSEAKKRGGVGPSREEMIDWYEQRNIPRAHAREQIKILPLSIRQKTGKAGRV